MKTERNVDLQALENEAYALERFFTCLKIEDIRIVVKNGHLVATDTCGNRWKDNQIYDFALNECLTFGPDGNLIKGFVVAADCLNPILEYASFRGVHIERLDEDPDT